MDYGLDMKFRNWVYQIWWEHLEEMMAWEGKQPNYTSQEYFNKYRWWLKREYRKQHGDS